MAALIATAALVAACGVGPSAQARRVSWQVGDTGLTLAPPGDPSRVRISAVAAYAQCFLGSASCGPGSPAAVELARAIDPGTSVLPADGGLVWALEWIDVQCPPSSGGPAVGNAIQPSPPGRCDEIAVIDAISGTFLFTQTGPHDQGRP